MAKTDLPPLTLGSVVRDVRRRANLTQRQLADRLDTDHTYISHLEADRRDPSIRMLRALAQELSVPPGLLLSLVLLADVPKAERARYADILRALLEVNRAASGP